MIQKTNMRIVLYLILLSCFGCAQQTTSVSKKPFQAIDDLLNEEHTANHFDGSIVIGTTDSILFQKHIGIANRSWKIPVEKSTRFDIASVNKSFIAALTMIAVDEGKLSLNSKLVDVLPNYNYTGSFNPEITIHQMLSHTSGLPDYGGVNGELSANGFLKLKRQHFSNAEYVDFISQIPPVSAPGQQFHYSNFAYHLLPIILEDLYQQPFNQILQSKICKPLQMEDTYNSVDNTAIHQNLAQGYNLNSKTNTWRSNDFIDLSLGRRVFSTSHDLYLWAKGFHTLLSDSSAKRMHTNHLKNITDKMSYGYGWVIYEAGHHFAMGDLEIDLPYIIHGGNTGGYKSMLLNIDGGRYIVAMLSNVGEQTRETELAQKIVKLLLENDHEN